MPTTTPWLRITDDSLTADLVFNIVNQTFGVEDGAWAPAVSPLRRSVLGGRGPYETTVEEIRVSVFGSSVAATLSNLGTLAELLHRADRWGAGENIAPVRIEFQPGGGSPGRPLHSLILGRAE